jgi:hypothetical protein
MWIKRCDWKTNRVMPKESPTSFHHFLFFLFKPISERIDVNFQNHTSPLKFFANRTANILRIFSELSGFLKNKNKNKKMVLSEDLTEREGHSPHMIS